MMSRVPLSSLLPPPHLNDDVQGAGACRGGHKQWRSGRPLPLFPRPSSSSSSGGVGGWGGGSWREAGGGEAGQSVPGCSGGGVGPPSEQQHAQEGRRGRRRGGGQLRQQQREGGEGGDIEAQRHGDGLAAPAHLQSRGDVGCEARGHAGCGRPRVPQARQQSVCSRVPRVRAAKEQAAGGGATQCGPQGRRGMRRAPGPGRSGASRGLIVRRSVGHDGRSRAQEVGRDLMRGEDGVNGMGGQERLEAGRPVCTCVTTSAAYARNGSELWPYRACMAGGPMYCEDANCTAAPQQQQQQQKQ